MSDDDSNQKDAEGFLLVIDELGKIIYVSESVLSHLGFAYVDLTGHSWFSLVHPDDQVYARTQLKESVTKCGQMVNSPTSASQSYRSSLMVRVVHGNRLENPTDRQPPEIGYPDETFNYKSFHFYGVARALKRESNSENAGGRSVVWVAVGKERPVSQSTNVDRSLASSAHSSPSHFVIRHDLSGQITWVDERCGHFIGQSPKDLVRSNLFDHLVKEDVPFLIHQYDQLKDKTESIAVIYRFRAGNKMTHTDVFLNCRAYLALNPVTFQLDRVVTLATAMTSAEGQLELKRQSDRLSSLLPTQQNLVKSYRLDLSSKRQNVSCVNACQPATPSRDDNCIKFDTETILLQLENADPASMCSSKKSPLQSPDSNTHPISPPRSDESGGETFKNSENSREGHRISMSPDSQSSPSKHSEHEHATGNSGQKKAPANEHNQGHLERVASDTGQPVKSVGNSARENPRKGDATQKRGKSKDEKEKRGRRQNDSHRKNALPPGFDAGANGMQNGSNPKTWAPSVANTVPVSELHGCVTQSPLSPVSLRPRPPISMGMDNLSQQGHAQLNQSVNPFSDAYFMGLGLDFGIGGNGSTQLDGVEEDIHSKADVRYLFHEQLRDKHRFLERSIQNQQQQLQQLQQKLIALATDGNPHSPLQMHIQRPLQRVMEIQNRLANHREQTLQQRTQVDIAIERAAPPLTPPSAVGSLPGSSAFPGNPTDQNSRRNSAPIILNGPILSPPNSRPAASVRASPRSNVMSPRLSVNEFVAASERRTDGAMSPPFVDMTKSSQPSSPLLGNNTPSFDQQKPPFPPQVLSSPKIHPLSSSGIPDHTLFQFNPTDSYPSNNPSLARSPEEYSSDADFDRGLLELENLLKFEFEQEAQMQKLDPKAESHRVATPAGSSRVDAIAGKEQEWNQVKLDGDLSNSTLAVT